ncbi:MAG: hypothetical protein L6V93_05380 [Clostridiales bacterium]|nr:MAG: hypothetical protein L6V93_05380 [Clostridiales bacterium]
MQTARYISTLGGADKFFDVPYGLEICNVGSGPAHYGIDYKFCKKKGFNFSTAPQNFYYGYKLLQHFSSHIKEKCYYYYYYVPYVIWMQPRHRTKRIFG